MNYKKKYVPQFFMHFRSCTWVPWLMVPHRYFHTCVQFKGTSLNEEKIHTAVRLHYFYVSVLSSCFLPYVFEWLFSCFLYSWMCYFLQASFHEQFFLFTAAFFSDYFSVFSAINMADYFSARYIVEKIIKQNSG